MCKTRARQTPRDAPRRLVRLRHANLAGELLAHLVRIRTLTSELGEVGVHLDALGRALAVVRGGHVHVVAELCNRRRQVGDERDEKHGERRARRMTRARARAERRRARRRDAHAGTSPPRPGNLALPSLTLALKSVTLARGHPRAFCAVDPIATKREYWSQYCILISRYIFS